MAYVQSTRKPVDDIIAFLSEHEEELDSLYRIMTKIKKNLIRIQVGGEEEEYASDNFERSERI